MGATFNSTTVNYRDQQQFNSFFATSFDKYDRNRDGKIDYQEFQPLINDMCQQIVAKYGNGPTVDKIRQAWYQMDTNRSGYITRQEFTTKAKREIERILSQPNYAPQAGYGQQHYPQQNVHMPQQPYPGYQQPHSGYQQPYPGYQQPHAGYQQPYAHGPMNYGPHGY